MVSSLYPFPEVAFSSKIKEVEAISFTADSELNDVPGLHRFIVLPPFLIHDLASLLVEEGMVVLQIGAKLDKCGQWIKEEDVDTECDERIVLFVYFSAPARSNEEVRAAVAKIAAMNRLKVRYG